VRRPRAHARRRVDGPLPRVRVLRGRGAADQAGSGGRAVLSGFVAHRGFCLARLDMRQRLETFYTMSKKVVVEYSRYPVAFAALFAQIFLIILLFIFSTVAFAGGDQTIIQNFGGAMAYGFVANMVLH